MKIKTRSVTKLKSDESDAKAKKTKNIDDVLTAIVDALDCFSETRLLDYATIIQESIKVTAEDNTSFSTFANEDDGDDSYGGKREYVGNGELLLGLLCDVAAHQNSTFASNVVKQYTLVSTQISDVLDIREFFKKINENNLADTINCIVQILDQANLNSFPEYTLEALQARASSIVHQQIVQEIEAFSSFFSREQVNDIVKILELRKKITLENQAEINIIVNEICEAANLQLEEINCILEIHKLLNEVSESNLINTNNRIAEICEAANLDLGVQRYNVQALQIRASSIVDQQIAQEIEAFSQFLSRGQINGIVDIFDLRQVITLEHQTEINNTINEICEDINLRLEQINCILEIRELLNAVSEENLANTNNRIAEICEATNFGLGVPQYVEFLQTRAANIVRFRNEAEARNALDEDLARNADDETEIVSVEDSDVVMQEENADNEIPIIGHDHQGFDGY